MSQKKWVKSLRKDIGVKLGGVYEVTSEDIFHYSFIDDDGDIRVWHKSYFEPYDKPKYEAAKVIALIAILILIAVLSSCSKHSDGVVTIADARGEVIVNYDNIAIDLYEGKSVTLQAADHYSIAVNCYGPCSYTTNGMSRTASSVIK